MLAVKLRPGWWVGGGGGVLSGNPSDMKAGGAEQTDNTSGGVWWSVSRLKAGKARAASG